MQRHLSMQCGVALTFGLLAAACGPAGESSSSTGTGGVSGATSSSSGASGDVSLVTTDKGPVKGVIVGETRAFLGIPYAAPPTGVLRWKPPQPAAAWTAPLDASKVGPACSQPDSNNPTQLAPGSSEDCLTLNVWAPKSLPAKAAPVMVWIHGGGFVTGSGSDPAYDGQALSEATGSVIVSLNYRLGPFGYLAHTALVAESPSHPSSGMYGFEDQRAALAWVKANIALFGGDPANVTAFGESAGGISISLHLVSPASAGLFKRVIIESGPYSPETSTTRPKAEAQGVKLAAALGCTDPATILACLRAKKTAEVLLALKIAAGTPPAEGVNWFPSIDGVDVPDDPQKLFAAGQFTKVDTLIGTNKNEGSVFLLGAKLTTDAEYLQILEAVKPGHGAAIAAQYPSATYGSPKAALAEALGDNTFVCATRRMMRAIAKGGAPTYVYQFTHVLVTPLGPELGAFHGSEIPFIFGNPFYATKLTDQEKPLSKTMIGYWSRLAASGDPNGGGAFPWPKYDAANDQSIVLDLTLSTQKGLKKSDCDFWDSQML
jgi:para-nitrobenzyl esterase